MDSTIIAAIIGAVAGVVAIVAGSFLGTHLTKQASIATAKELAALEQRKLIRDRLWDHQRESYSTMIASVWSMWGKSLTLAEAFKRGESDHPGFTKESEEFWKLWFETSTLFHANRLIFSHEFHDRFDKLFIAVGNGKADNDDGDYFEWMSGLLGDAVASLVEIARRDIGSDLPPA